jgi:hypothetical protein
MVEVFYSLFSSRVILLERIEPLLREQNTIIVGFTAISLFQNVRAYDNDAPISISVTALVKMKVLMICQPFIKNGNKLAKRR